MRKIFFSIGAIFISLLLVSTGTAVRQTYSKPIMNAVEEIELQKTQFHDILTTTSSNVLSLDGIIDFIKQLITWVIQLLVNLIDLIKSLIVVVGLVEYLVRLIEILFNLIQRVIDAIMDLFNPDEILS